MASRAKRNQNGQFKAGTSGNPKGRPKGALNRDKLRELIASDAEAILRALIAKAKDGDTRVALAILDRIMPPLKAAELPAELGELAGTRTEQGEAIMRAMAAGILTPGQTAQLLAALASQAKLAEVDELERRIAALETMAKDQ